LFDLYREMFLAQYNSEFKSPLIKLMRVFFVSGLIAIAVSSASANWQTFGRFSRITERMTNGLVIETSSRSKVSIEFFDLHVIRIRFAPNGKFERNHSYAIQNLDRKIPLVKLSETASTISLKNSIGERIVIRKSSLLIAIFDEKGHVVVEDESRKTSEFDADTGEIRTTKIRRGETETYYGFGEKTFAGMSRHGQYITNWNTDTFSYPVGLDPIYQTIPFFFALKDGKAYGLFFHNTFRSFFDMGKTSPANYSFGASGGELDYFVFTGGKDRTPKKILEDYSNLTGRTPLPPLWSLGYQQSRWSYSPDSRVREIAKNFRERKIPADVIYLDIDYMDGFRVFTWDETRFPAPKQMLSDLREEGFRIVSIIDPGIKVDDSYSIYTDGKSKNLFVKNPDGSELHAKVWPGVCAFPDFTNPKAREWFGGLYRKNLDEGIAGFWNDMNEPAAFLDDKTDKPDIYHHPRKTFPYDTPHFGEGSPDDHRRFHNVYGMQMARASYEGLRNLRPDSRPFVLTRAGFAGIQRFSAVWTGDNVASWEHLALTIPMLANLSVSGVSFVGADVGGFNETPSGELFARWLQAAALTPFFRGHSVGSAKNKEPWEFGSEWEKINRATIEMRYQFLPYLYTLFYQHEKTGAPVMRPLWYEYPNDSATYLIDDEFLVGKDILVAPVLREGQISRGIYLPKGDEWMDWWTGERFESGKVHNIKTPLDRLPVFVRVGSVIPTQPTIQYTDEAKNFPITLNVIAGISPERIESTIVYQDEGDGYRYRKSDFCEIRVEHRKGILRLNKVGSFAGQKVRFIEAIGIAKRPSAIVIDGKPSAEFEFDANTKRLRISISDQTNEIALRP